jgi:hypothetical protein
MPTQMDPIDQANLNLFYILSKSMDEVQKTSGSQSNTPTLLYIKCGLKLLF